jgi:diguanylate cyclase (GGDEF)-like protein
LEFNSHGIWGQGNQLENGIAANGMSGKENLTKIEFINQNVYHVRSTYVEVDGYPYLLELVVQITEETHMDHFNAINDTYGHPVGDLALKQAAKAIKNCVKRTDSVVRFGGDEIFVVFGDIPFHMLQEKLEEIRSCVDKAVIPDYPQLKLSISIGGVYGPGQVSDLMEAADRLLFQVKREKAGLKIKEKMNERL